MKSRYALVLVLALATLPGCASLPIVAIPRPPQVSQAQVVVFRESSFIAGGVSLSVGTGNKAFAAISNTEYVEVNLPAGEQDIFVQARTAEPTRVRLTLQRGTRVCLRTSSSKDTLAKVVIPITLIATGYHFYLDVVPCLSAAEMSRYKKVHVTYAEN